MTDPREGLGGLAEVAEAIGATPKKTEKVALLVALLRALPVDEAGTAALFLSGRVFPAREETTLQVGGRLLWQAVARVSSATDEVLGAAYRRQGDLGAAAFELLEVRAAEAGKEGGAAAGLGLLEVERELRLVAGERGPASKLARVEALLRRATPLEAKYLVKVITGELRIGLKESLVEEAVAAAHEAPAGEVQRANMMLGDLGQTLRLAAAGQLGEARMQLFHPVGFMLATAAESAVEAFESLPSAQVEDKYDGIRAQAHCGGAAGVRLFSRTRDEVTASFPELAAPLAAFALDAILDGEIVAWRAGAGEEEGAREGEREGGAALPFAALQKRLGRKRVTPAMRRAVPVAFVAFDVLFVGGELVVDLPLRERAEILDALFAGRRAVPSPAPPAPARGQLALALEAPESPAEGVVLRAPRSRVESAVHLDALFDASRARGNEGLMVKDVESPYTPGRRGRAWLKLKRELATLDVVVTGVELGHGKRAGVLSDYTFAVRDGERLVAIGKAYTGLTDAEIAGLTAWFREHTLEDRGHFRSVEPTLVLEVAFNNLMRSDRHESGFALRFPRIVRVRADKSAAEVATLDDVRALFERAGG